MGNLLNKTILVTGSTSGIGEAAVIYFLTQGASVLALGRNDLKLQKLKNINPFKITTLNCDLEREQGFLCDSNIDGIFHAAGNELLLPARSMTRESLDSLMRVSVHSVYTIISSVLRASSITRNVSMVMMSSVAGIRGSAGMSAYAASKAAIDAMTRSLAVEYAPYWRFNSIVCGAVETPMHERIRLRVGSIGMDQHKRDHLLGFGHPIDIAKAASFLLSDDSKWITGTNMVVDGGLSCR